MYSPGSPTVDRIGILKIILILSLMLRMLLIWGRGDVLKFLFRDGRLDCICQSWEACEICGLLLLFCSFFGGIVRGVLSYSFMVNSSS